MDAVSAELIRASGGSPAVDGDRARWHDRDWEQLLQLAEWHRLGGALHRHVADVGPVPGWVAERLEESYLRQLARSALFAHTQRVVLEGLAGVGIAAMLLKGAALLEAVYDDPATRDIGDLDLLVRAGDYDGAASALGVHGFHPESPGRRPGLPRRTRASVRPHSAPLYSGNRIVPVELHHHIVDSDATSDAFDPAELWVRGQLSVKSAPHLVPAREDLLLHVCLHFTRGRAIRSEGALAQVRDMASIIDRCEIDWQRFVANARRYQVAGRTFLALFTLDELGFLLPEAPLAALRPPRFDVSTGHRFIVQRVLADELWLPVADWAVSLEGLRTALWWGRRNLASREDLAPEEPRPLLSRRRGLGALLRLLGQSITHPGTVVRAVQVSKWMERSV